ncbi:MAG: DUF58 domain-containing protein [Opitutaceae bacterium]
MTPEAEAGWSGPGKRGPRAKFSWSALLWALIYPQRGQKIRPTLPGMVLIGLSLGIGTAAYNSSSNILFITLSLLLSCLILSGVLSWLNLRRVEWRLLLSPPLRAGQDATVTLELRNGKRFLATYGLWFEFAARLVESTKNHRAESTLNARPAELRAALAKADAAERRERVALPGRLDPGGENRIEWTFKPERRGRLRVAPAAVGSVFPFGFLRKDIGTGLLVEVLVWPAPTEYRRHGAVTARAALSGRRAARAGTNGDLMALRHYTPGDSPRLVHWKATARAGKLLVRQHAAESVETISIWLRTDAEVWTRPEQFELLISLAATLAEDFFRAGSLATVAINAEPPIAVRRARDLDVWLDRLAVAEPAAAGPEGASGSVAKQNVLTFAPDGARGVVALVGGEKAASA